MSFLIDYCDHKAAKFAVQHWHYSKRMPAGKLYKLGLWEDDLFKGVILFGLGANNNLLTPYGLTVNEGCELVRIAFTEHKTPVTQCVKFALKMLKRDNPSLKLVVSYADSRQNHYGGIYQGGNWIFTGGTKTTLDYFINGRWMHMRSVNSLYGSVKKAGNKVKGIRDGGYRFRYIYVLDKSIRGKIERLREEYPKSAHVV